MKNPPPVFGFDRSDVSLIGSLAVVKDVNDAVVKDVVGKDVMASSNALWWRWWLRTSYGAPQPMLYPRIPNELTYAHPASHTQHHMHSASPPRTRACMHNQY
jgi:hypothetical protein